MIYTPDSDYFNKANLEVPKKKVLGYTSVQRSNALVKRTKKVIDKMVEKDMPLSVTKIALHAGCSKSFLYKNKEIREYIDSTNKKPTVGSKTYSSMEAANKRIRELETENIQLVKETLDLQKQLIHMYDLLGRITQLSNVGLEDEISDLKEEISKYEKNRQDGSISKTEE